MGLLNFVKESGQKLFSRSEAEAAAPDAPSAEDLNIQAAQAIETYIASQNLGTSDVKVAYESAQGHVTVTGEAPTQAAKEKVTLCCGNISSVTSVENEMSVTTPEPAAQFHDVVRGDTLSAIAKQFYGNANKYPQIFAANQPMLTDPDKIYPGQKLRIPVL